MESTVLGALPAHHYTPLSEEALQAELVLEVVHALAPVVDEVVLLPIEGDGGLHHVVRNAEGIRKVERLGRQDRAQVTHGVAYLLP
jgi:redox-regulated HSP33 family molecular chaperone